MTNRTPATPVRRFWRLMGLMAAIAALAVAGAIWYFQTSGTQLRLHVVLATGLGIALTLLLAGALMGLVFFSSRSGHDDAAYDMNDEDER